MLPNEKSLRQGVPRHKPGLFGGLGRRLTLSFCFISILVLIAVNLAALKGIPFTRYGGRTAEHKADAFRMLNLVADLKKTQLLNWVEETRNDLKLAAGEKEVRTSVARLRDTIRNHAPPAVRGPDPWSELRQHEAYLSLKDYLGRIKSARGTTYEALRIADAESGLVLASSTDADEGTNISLHGASNAYAGALSTGSDYVSDIRSSRLNGKPSLYFGHVVKGPQGGVEAVLLLNIDVSAVFTLILHTGGGLGATSEALLVNKEQAVLVPLKFPMADGTIAIPLETRINAEPSRLGAGGREGSIEVEDYRGVPVLAAYRHIRLAPDLGWGMVVKFDRSEILAPLKADVESSLIVGLAGIVLIIVLTTAIAGWIVRPIRQLTRTATLLASGERSVRTGLKRTDEIGLLAAAFDSMADQIRTVWADLEDQANQLTQSRDTLAHRQNIQDGVLAVSNALASAGSLDAVLDDGLSQLMKTTNSQVGAIYLRDETLTSIFSLRRAIGVSHGAELPSVAAQGEGAVGLAAQRKEVVILRELPPDTPYAFLTIAGMVVPRSILNVPLIFHDQVVGVAALASVYPLSPEHYEVVELCRNQLAIAVTNALAHTRTKRLAEKLGVSNEELQAANEELHAQSEELRVQTDEMRHQSKELERRSIQAEESDRLKSQFLSNVSHELRTPLNSIIALSQLLIHHGTGHDPAQDLESLNVIERNGMHLLNMINDLLDLAKIESGHMDIHVSDVDPLQVVRKAVEIVRPLAEQKGLEVEVDLHDIGSFRSDESRLAQILLNLLANAVKFTQTGKIGVRVSASDDTVTFAVSDTGIGIGPGDLSNIFQEFRQVDGSSTRKYEGTGLGLSIAGKLAGMLGGDISVSSVAGEGSTFSVTLPVHFPSESEAFPAALTDPFAPAPICAERPQCPHILVVEDNETAAMQIRWILQENGYVVSVASGGAEACACLERFVPDGVILDLMMPVIDGFQVLDRIRSTSATARVPVVVLTARDLTREEQASLQLNKVQELIMKGGVDRGQLVDAVGRVVGRPVPRAFG